MRKLIAGLVTSLVLLIGGNALPADAFVLQPYTIGVASYFNCSVEVTYGWYGNVYAETYFRTQHCNGYTAIQAVGVRNGSVVRRECNLITVVFNPGTPGCAFVSNVGFAGIHAQVAGDTAIGGSVLLCPDSVPVPYAPCSRVGFGPWGL